MVRFIGTITGKVTTRHFEFIADGEVKKFDYCQVHHNEYGHVLCQVTELEKTSERLLAKCAVIGYRNGPNIRQIRSPFDAGVQVHRAPDDFIRKVITLDEVERGAYVGMLEGTQIPVYLDLNRLLTKHVAILAKTGSGKSYSVGVLLEEIMEKNVPLVIIDPHGEYRTLREENDSVAEVEMMKRFNIKPKSYARKTFVYGDSEIDGSQKPLRLSESLSTEELTDVLPGRLTSSQLGLLYSTVKELDVFSLDNLIGALQAQDNSLKWNLISLIDRLRGLRIFSGSATSLNELVQSGRCSIINMKGIEPQVQEIIVYKLLRDLFQERKLERVPPFFLVIEEAHNFVPEKGYSDAKCSKVIKTIASEGRKFGLGLCVVSQRPAIVQKTILSQCTTQIILKITNPNDLRAIANSVEGITSETETEIRNLPVGTALVTGVVDMPLFVNFRPRKTKHGGEAVDILGMQEGEEKFFDSLKDFRDKKLLPLIVPKLTPRDIELMSERKPTIATVLVPCTLFLCERNSREFSLLAEMVRGSIVTDIESLRIKSAFLPDFASLSPEEMQVLQKAFALRRFTKESFRKATGLSMDADRAIDSLNAKSYLENRYGNYVLSETYILNDIARHAFHGKIQYQRCDTAKMLKKKVRLDTMKARLARFAGVKDQRECFLVHYSVK